MRSIKMAQKFLAKLKFKISIKYLIFFLIVLIGCFYQVFQVTTVYLEYETKIDVSFDSENQMVIPRIAICPGSPGIILGLTVCPG